MEALSHTARAVPNMKVTVVQRVATETAVQGVVITVAETTVEAMTVAMAAVV